ncbi:hypothetical protein ACHQM5_016926 [Ranunculus cassubicifolius]
MAESPKQVVQIERITVKNSHGENLVGLLHHTGSAELVILCHGLGSSKEDPVMANLADAITQKGISVFRFDFAGNGESEGSFQFGNYLREVEDLRSVVQNFSGGKHAIITILGHSKGANVVLLYASRYNDAPTIINASGRYNLETGLEERLGKDFLQIIKRDGFIDIKNKNGEVQYRITEESLMERLGIDMHAACLSIEKHCRIFTVHGSDDEVIPVEDAFEFAKILPNHQLQIVEGADHCYTNHQAELAKVVLNFVDASLPHGKM